jgi:nicotinamidase-related amidase
LSAAGSFATANSFLSVRPKQEEASRESPWERSKIGLYPMSFARTTRTIMSSAVTMGKIRTVGKLHPSSSCLLLCDMQERFYPLTHNMDTVMNTCQYMVSVAQALSIPVVVTEQYSKFFGPTLKGIFTSSGTPLVPVDNPESKAVECPVPVYEKTKFSMITPEVEAVLDPARKSFIIVGIETHVCVQQTVLDLLDKDYEVHVIVDGVSSQRVLDRETALHRMSQAGAFLTTAQSATYMLLQDAKHPQFKACAQYTKNHMTGVYKPF